MPVLPITILNLSLLSNVLVVVPEDVSVVCLFSSRVVSNVSNLVSSKLCNIRV